MAGTGGGGLAALADAGGSADATRTAMTRHTRRIPAHNVAGTRRGAAQVAWPSRPGPLSTLPLVGVLALLSRCFRHPSGGPSQYGRPPLGQTRLTSPAGCWNGLAILVMLALPFLLRLAVAARHVVVRAAAVGVLPATVAVV